MIRSSSESPPEAGRSDLEQRLGAALARHPSVVVAFSGGADSALVAHVALEVLGAARTLAVTADSPSLPRADLAHCATLADTWGLPWQSVLSAEMEDPGYVANGWDRCAHCKSALMEALGPVVSTRPGATVVLGVNLDDLGEHRPGQDVARERGAAFPLVEAGLTKADVRDLSLRRGLSTWDRPQAACLASRVPNGTPVSVELLARVERAEAAVRCLGFAQLRVRDHGEVARLEVPVEDLPAALALRPAIVEACTAAGYRFVALDLAGFRSGSLAASGDPSGAGVSLR